MSKDKSDFCDLLHNSVPSLPFTLFYFIFRFHIHSYSLRFSFYLSGVNSQRQFQAPGDISKDSNTTFQTYSELQLSRPVRELRLSGGSMSWMTIFRSRVAPTEPDHNTRVIFVYFNPVILG